ncbi:MAG: hypothetical protein ACKON9_17625, partial [Planctomycetaceae bacterium]
SRQSSKFCGSWSSAVQGGDWFCNGIILPLSSLQTLDSGSIVRFPVSGDGLTKKAAGESRRTPAAVIITNLV